MGRAMARGLGPGSWVCNWEDGVGVVRLLRVGLLLLLLVRAGLLVLVLARRMRTWGPGKRMVPAPMRTKVPFVGAWERGAAMERRAVVVFAVAGR